MSSDPHTLTVPISRIVGTPGNDHLIGTPYDDLLVGNGGTDILEGGAGNDTYEITDVYSSTVIEAADAGTDTVVLRFPTGEVVIQNGEAQTSVVPRYVLPTNVENLSVYGDLATQLVGNAHNNFIVGGNAFDHIEAGAGDDIINGRGGNNHIDGGAGIDKAMIEARTYDLRIVRNADGSLDVTKPNGTVDHLVDVERIGGTDGTLMLDQGANGVTAWRLIDAATGWPPIEFQVPGVRAQLDAGASVASVAARLMEGVEYQNQYGNAQTSEAFVDALYRNVLGRAADAGGKAAQLDALAHGVTRAELLANFALSGESVAVTGGLATESQLFVYEVGLA
jgi:hypothetical protein